MTRAATLLAGLVLLAATAVAFVPSAGANAFTCNFAGPPTGGIVGRTYEYATNVGEAVCWETLAYAFDVCVYALGSHPLCHLA